MTSTSSRAWRWARGAGGSCRSHWRPSARGQRRPRSSRWTRLRPRRSPAGCSAGVLSGALRRSAGALCHWLVGRCAVQVAQVSCADQLSRRAPRRQLPSQLPWGLEAASWSWAGAEAEGCLSLARLQHRGSVVSAPIRRFTTLHHTTLHHTSPHYTTPHFTRPHHTTEGPVARNSHGPGQGAP